MSMSANFTLIRAMNPMKKSERSNYDISDLSIGSYLKIDNTFYTVIEKSSYREVDWDDFLEVKYGDTVTELTLKSLTDLSILYVEYYQDDGIQIYKTDKEISLRDISITRNDLDYFAKEEEGKIRYQGTTYYYQDEESWAAMYSNSNDIDIPVRFYEFSSDDGESLTVEVWLKDLSGYRGNREAFISSKLSPKDIEILQLK